MLTCSQIDKTATREASKCIVMIITLVSLTAVGQYRFRRQLLLEQEVILVDSVMSAW